MKMKYLILLIIYCFMSCKNNPEGKIISKVVIQDTILKAIEVKKKENLKSKYTKLVSKKQNIIPKNKVEIKISPKDERLEVVLNDTIYYKRNIEDRGGWSWCPKDKPNMGLYFDVKKKTWYAIKNGKDQLVPDLGVPCRESTIIKD